MGYFMLEFLLPGPTMGCLNPNILISCDFVAQDIESLSSKGIQSMIVEVEDRLSSKPSLDFRNFASSVAFFGLKCYQKWFIIYIVDLQTGFRTGKGFEILILRKA
jgi:hypothetical protein